MKSTLAIGRWPIGLLGMCALFAACGGESTPESPQTNAKAQRVLAMNQVTDHHSYARPAEARPTLILQISAIMRAESCLFSIITRL